MIVVLGSPVAARSGVPGGSAAPVAGGLPVDVAAAATAAGGRVELVGTVGDDAAGDSVVVDLGGRGIGHAALLRDPATATPVLGDPGARSTRLEPADVELGLQYIADVGVLVVVEPLPAPVLEAAVQAASFHGAQVLAIAAKRDTGRWQGDRVTVLQRPAVDSTAFVEMAGRYAAGLDAGAAPRDALASAAAAAGWETAR
jgi:sugar/nucleoside kinase (ribokinase family)